MKKLLMLNLGNYFVTAKGGYYPQIIKEFSNHFDKVFVFCLGSKGKKKFNSNTEIYSGNIIKWIHYFSKIDKKDIKYVYIQDYTIGGLLGAIFSKILKVPLVMRCGGTWEHKNNSFINVIKNLIIKMTKPLVLKNVSRIVFNSKYIKKKVLGGRKIKNYVVYNGVDKKIFYPPTKKELGKRLIYVGRVREDKGLLYLRDAMKELKDYTLTIVGEGPLIKELKKEHNIKCVGKMEHSKIASILRQHDIFIFPTLPESSESFPSSVIEAMACGLSIVATNVAGIPEMIKNRKEGFLIKPYSSEEIIKGINKVNNINLEKVQDKIINNYNVKTQLKELSEELFKK